jgi:hypothetical protein
MFMMIISKMAKRLTQQDEWNANKELTLFAS